MAVIGEMLQLKIGEKTYTLPAGGGGTITKVQTSAGVHTTVNVSSGAVSFNVPTKTSHLTNDSGFITNAGVTSVTTTAGAHTAISGSTGAVSFNVPTKTSHLTNDSGFLTSHQTLYEANLNWGGKDFSASYGPVDAAMIDVLGANRFAFLKAAGLTIEYSTNGGSSYTDYGATDAQKVGLFSSGQSFYLGKHSTAGSCTTNDRLRVTINTGAAGIYTVLNKIAIYMSTQGSTVQVLIERALESTPTTFTTHKDWTGISGWSGWNILNISGLTTYGNTVGSQYGRIRFTFRATAVNTTYSAALITKIQGFGGQGWTTPSNMAASGHLYSYDSSQNATFPAKVTASGGFSGALTGNVTGDVTGNVSGTAANVTGVVAIANGGTGQTTAANAINALLNGLPVWTADPTDTTYFVRQDTGGSASYGKVAFSTIWNYISGKLPSWSKASTKPSYTASEVGAAASDHAHGNITNGGDITATAPTIANGDQIIINDHSASKITNGPTFDGSTTTKALTPKGTWETFSKFSGSYNDLTNKPTIPTVPSNVSAFTNDSGYITSADVPEGASAYTGTISEVGTTASNGTNNGFARGDHVHNITSATIISALGYTPYNSTNPDGYISSYTDEKLKWTASTSSNTYYPLQSTSTATTSTANTLNSVSFYQYYNTAGGYRRLILGNSTAYTSTGGAYGTIRLYGTGATYYGDLNPGTVGANSLTANRTWTLPNATGTIALTSDIPSVPTSAASATTGITASTTANTTSVSGSDLFSATVISHVLSFSHSAKTVSTSSATVTITDNGHTHTLS